MADRVDPRGWVKSAAWDGAFLLSGLWLAPVAWLLARGAPRVDESPAAFAYFLLAIPLWIGHRLSSSFLAYCTVGYRPLLATQRARFVVAPIFTAVLVFAFLLPPDAALPWTRVERVALLVVADYALNTWHFAAQHFGVLSLYRTRAGRAADRATRAADRLFALVVGGGAVLAAEIVAGAAFLPAAWTAVPVVEAARAAVRVVGTALVVGGAIASAVRAPSVPRTLYVGNVAVMVLAAYWLDPFLFLFVWTVQHWTAASGLASLAAHGDADPGASRWYRFWRAVAVRPAGTLLALAGMSALLFPLFDVEASGVAGRDVGAAATAIGGAISTSTWAPFLVALGFASAFLHYQLDRAVFRFSHPEVRQAAERLLRGA